MASTRKLIVQVVGDARSLSKTLKQAAWESMSFGEKVAASTKRMAVPAAAAFAGLSASAVAFAKAAAEDQKAAALLASQLRTTTGATTAQIAATEDYIAKLSMAAGVADDVLRPALASLVRATGDVAKAQNLLRLGLDISAATGRDLGSVVQALSRASMGQFTALRRLGVPLSDNIVKSKDFAAAVEALTAVFGGKADVAAQTTEGRMRRLGVAVDEAKESIGAALLPALEAILPRLIKLAQWAENNAGVIVGVGTAVGVFAAGVVAAAAGLKIWGIAATITTAINSALATSFFAVQISTGVLAATAIAGAIAVGVIAYKMSQATKSTKEFTASLEDNREATRKALAYDVAKGLLPESSLRRFDENTKRLQGGFSAAGSSADSAAQKFEKFRDRLKQTKDSVRQYVASIRDAIAGSVSLSDAFSQAQQEQQDAAQGLKDALEARASAYEALNQAQQTGDTIAYAKALKDVADAEAAVGAAQAVKARDYTQVFRDQITAAKTFAANLVALNKTGTLSRAALQQLLDLGPVAGAKVTADLLAGVGGFTAASLSADIAGVQAAGRAVGLSVPGVSELLGAGTGGQGQNYYITVQTGVGDKNAIAREVVDLLKVYNRSNGAIPVRVSG